MGTAKTDTTSQMLNNLQVQVPAVSWSLNLAPFWTQEVTLHEISVQHNHLIPNLPALIQKYIQATLYSPDFCYSHKDYLLRNSLTPATLLLIQVTRQQSGMSAALRTRLRHTMSLTGKRRHWFKSSFPWTHSSPKQTFTWVHSHNSWGNPNTSPMPSHIRVVF